MHANSPETIYSAYSCVLQKDMYFYQENQHAPC